jgi:C4-dicarboxylate transporter, DctM subunit
MALSQTEKTEKRSSLTFSDRLGKVEKFGALLGGVIILVMMIMTFIDTLLRQLFNRPISGVYELQSMLLVGVVYFGLSFIQSKRGHIRMDIISVRLSSGSQLVLQLLGDTVFLAVTVLITWQMGLQAWTAWLTGDYLAGVVHFPLAPAKTVLVLGTTLTSIRLITDIIINPLWHRGEEISRRSRISGIITAAVILIIIIAGLAFAKSLALPQASVGWVVIILFMVLLFIGVPVAPAMALIGGLGFWLLLGTKSALGTAGTVPFGSTSEYLMTVLPLFIVMGAFAGLAGFAEKGFDLAKRWLENVRGGIVYATIVGSTIFAAATGSGAASCAVLSGLTLPEMLKSKVNRRLAIGVIASASSLAIMIPPSTSFVIYAMLTGNSIGKLLIAGIIPGLVGAAAIMVMVYIRSRIDPKLAGSVPLVRSSWKQRFSAIPSAWGIVLIVFVIIGGIFSGFFTPTEAGAVGAFVTFVAVIVLKKAGWRKILDTLVDSAGISVMILFILVGGVLFGNMISLSRLPVMLSQWVVSLSMPPILVLISIMVVYFILGCFLDSLSIMIITLPIIYPIILKLGFDPIWFGVLQVQNMEIAAVTPPYGMNLFILKGILKDVPMSDIFIGSMWFVLPMIATMAIYIAFPQLATWLPNLMTK